MSHTESLPVDDNTFDEDGEHILEELESDEAEPVSSTEKQIEKKYNEGQARIIIQRNDFLVPNLLSMCDRKEVMDVSPPYQRRARWGAVKRSHLIESLLMNIPIPPIFLYERDYAKYEVMDGQQRLAAVRSFFRNEFRLRGLKKWPELNGRDYRDLPLTIQRGLERRGLAAIIILTESSKNPKAAMEIRQYVFERLNTGGEQLNAQEIRNCLYAGSFNDLLVSLARSDNFTAAWGIPTKESTEPQKVTRKLERNPLYAKMADCEIVLRYFALKELSHFKGGMKKALDDCMIRNRDLDRSQCEALGHEYAEALSIALSVFGTKLFRLEKDGDLAGRRSVPLADGILIACGKLRDHREKLATSASAIVSATVTALQNRDKHELLVGRGNTKKAVEQRLSVMESVISEAAQL